MFEGTEAGEERIQFEDEARALKAVYAEELEKEGIERKAPDERREKIALML